MASGPGANEKPPPVSAAPTQYIILAPSGDGNRKQLLLTSGGQRIIVQQNQGIMKRSVDHVMTGSGVTSPSVKRVEISTNQTVQQQRVTVRSDSIGPHFANETGNVVLKANKDLGTATETPSEFQVMFVEEHQSLPMKQDGVVVTTTQGSVTSSGNLIPERPSHTTSAQTSVSDQQFHLVVESEEPTVVLETAGGVAMETQGVVYEASDIVSLSMAASDVGQETEVGETTVVTSAPWQQSGV